MKKTQTEIKLKSFILKGWNKEKNNHINVISKE